MTTLMRRWEMDAIGRAELTLREVPVPRPASGEVLIRVGVNDRELLGDLAVCEAFTSEILREPHLTGLQASFLSYLSTCRPL